MMKRKKLFFIVLLCCALLLCACGTEYAMKYEDFCEALHVMGDLDGELGEGETPSEQTAYAQFRQIYAADTPEELRAEYDYFNTLLAEAQKHGYRGFGKKADDTARLGVSNVLTDEYEADYGLTESERKYKEDVLEGAQKRGITTDQYIDEVLVPFIVVESFAAAFLKDYYYENIYEGPYRACKQKFDSLCGEDGAPTVEAGQYWNTDEFQQAYASFMQEYSAYYRAISEAK